MAEFDPKVWSQEPTQEEPSFEKNPSVEKAQTEEPTSAPIDMHNAKRWQTIRVMASTIAPYDADYIYRLQPQAQPGSNKITLSGEWNLVYDPEFTDEEIVWELLEMVYHLYMDHFDRVKDKDRELFGLASCLEARDSWRDSIIRSSTEKKSDGNLKAPFLKGFVDGSWRPGTVFPEQLGLPRGLNANAYYRLLCELAEKASAEGEGIPINVHAASPGSGGGQGKEEKENDENESGEGGAQGEQDKTQNKTDDKDEKGKGTKDKDGKKKGQGTSGSGAPDPRGMYNPCGFTESEKPGESKELEKMKNRAERLIGEMKNDSDDYGSVPGNFTRNMGRGTTPRVSLEGMLKYLVTEATGDEDYKKTGKFNSRSLATGMIMSSLKEGRPNLVVIEDLSGSVSDDLHATMINIIAGWTRTNKVWYCAADTQIRYAEDSPLAGSVRERLRKTVIRAGGGTDMVFAVNEAKKKYPDTDAFIVISDMETRLPTSSKEFPANTVWVVANRRSKDMEFPKFMRFIHRINPDDLVRDRAVDL
jgi:predicted metal-dependent peptidase